MQLRGGPYLLILPAAGLFAGLFVAPFVYFFVVSFWRVKTYRLIPDVTVANYAATFAQYVEVGRFTFAMALTVGLLTTALGFVYAYIIRFKAGRWGTLLLFAALTTLFGGIVVPRCRTGLTAAFVFCFLIAAGDYVTPLLVGGKITMIGNLIAPQFGQFFNWPLGSAMSFVILFAALGVVALAGGLMSLWRPR